MSNVKKTPKWIEQVPNALTVIRLVMVPFLVWLMLAYPDRTMPQMWGAFVLFTAAAFTDKFDGDIARKYNIVSNFGKIADPIADKALVLPALVIIVWNMWGRLNTFIVILSFVCVLLIVLRELGISVWRMVLVRRGKVVPASPGGKVKTVTQMAFIGFSLIPWNTFLSSGVVIVIEYILVALLVIATYLALASAKDYVFAR
ncbi:CDP-diacylglycerol--glycerol-3-phosphate 3-phosphatidyltransferase [Boudabousia marimammalium]|uniref:CDP-diacylglycerol--glycerol-3-phosphate 3-phosphatidyltransferase n=1 Tax=Boudabousia marimammalium TaxID=156892 RepID=A0A1Q5PNV5_9ACTO|nr:CDP-diacylglycerol--glycerol-3-phosphate 3-phosphatidyltransferase [Boudabousia marimammalium]OKL49268.1 CDP-diacylglycerol--glycerol-3-phosphate 3-phosphatidyltransferase [Boudabousia marimammalium]